MKTEWQFFEAVDFRFDKERKYKVTAEQPVDLGNGLIEHLNFEVRIEPDNHCKCPTGIEQIGTLYITFACSKEEAH